MDNQPMSFIAKIKNFSLSTNQSILIAGTMIALSILVSSAVFEERIISHARIINIGLKDQNQALQKISDNMKLAAPVNLDKETFDRIFSICMAASTKGLGLNAALSEHDNAKKTYCLSKILKTDIE